MDLPFTQIYSEEFDHNIISSDQFKGCCAPIFGMMPGTAKFSAKLKKGKIARLETTFNDLATQFKKDFTEAFTNEKLIELIQLTIEKLFPILDTTKIYEQMCSQFNIDYTTVDIESIESYIDNYFN